jgi:hypothetical protein
MNLGDGLRAPRRGGETQENPARDPLLVARSCGELDGPALWSAGIEAGRITEWRVRLDTPGNRKLLALAITDTPELSPPAIQDVAQRFPGTADDSELETFPRLDDSDSYLEESPHRHEVQPLRIPIQSGSPPLLDTPAGWNWNFLESSESCGVRSRRHAGSVRSECL